MLVTLASGCAGEADSNVEPSDRGDKNRAGPARSAPLQRARPPEGGHDERPGLQPLLQKIAGRYKLPGMAAAVVRGESIVAAGVVGVRRLGDETPIAADDRFHIGSCTKAMTATLCAVLVEEGRLSWTTPIGETFPDLKPKMSAEFGGITLEQLLTHRGGLTGDLRGTAVWDRAWEHRGRPREARRMLLEGLLDVELAARPGEKSIYSNAGYAIAGHMAETAAGRPFEELMQARLFEPLGMKTAGFGPPGKAGVLDEPRGHRPTGKPLEPGPRADNPPAIAPAGRVHCSIRDWAKFAALHLQAARGRPKLLGAETFRKLHGQQPRQRPAGDDDDRHAMGWIVVEQPWTAGPALTHGGSNTFWFAVCWIAPGRDFAVLVACNQYKPAAERACNDVVLSLIARELQPRR